MELREIGHAMKLILLAVALSAVAFAAPRTNDDAFVEETLLVRRLPCLFKLLLVARVGVWVVAPRGVGACSGKS